MGRIVAPLPANDRIYRWTIGKPAQPVSGSELLCQIRRRKERLGRRLPWAATGKAWNVTDIARNRLLSARAAKSRWVPSSQGVVTAAILIFCGGLVAYPL